MSSVGYWYWLIKEEKRRCPAGILIGKLGLVWSNNEN